MTTSLIDLFPGAYQVVPVPKPVPKPTSRRVQGFDPATGIIRVWHSSPFDFDEFSIEYLGNGDGHSTHAYGQYFAEHPSIGGYFGRYWHNFHGRFTDAETMLNYTNGDREEAIRQGQQYLEDFEKGLIDKGYGMIAGINKQIKKRVEKAIPVVRQKYPSDPLVYDVALKATPEQFLTFDKQLPEELWKRIEAGTRDIILGKADAEGIPLGKYLYRIMRKPEVVETLPRPEISDPEERLAAFLLNELGLVGSRYLDQKSRDPKTPESERSYNYTVWDLPIIKIVKKTGGIRERRTGDQH